MQRTLVLNDRGADVLALQTALNRRAESRFYPPLVLDEELGPTTMQAFQAIGWALGLVEDTLNGRDISVGAQRLVLEPGAREAKTLARARARAPKLHARTVGFDGAPTYWGLAKPLLLAREHGWSGQLSASDRRAGVPEKFGKKSQKALFDCFTQRQVSGRCPPSCGGDCNPANRPGQSSHEQRSDGSAFPGPVGRLLLWWELGIDVSNPDGLQAVLAELGYKIRRTYPDSERERQHLNFTASPGPVLPPQGPASKAIHPAVAHAAKATAAKPKTKGASAAVVSLTGPDVSLNQPDVDWAKVRAAGHDFAIAKVTDGLGTPDTAFGKARWKAMRDAGLVRGAYHFGRPQKGRDPKKEVTEYFSTLKTAGGLDDGDLVPILDLEKFGSAGNLTAADTVRWAHQWVREARRQVGRHPIIYTGAFWRDAMKNPPDNFGCPLWLAAYVPKSELKSTIPMAWREDGISLWQYTDRGACPGIPVPCDLSRFHGRRSAFDHLRI